MPDSNRDPLEADTIAQAYADSCNYAPVDEMLDGGFMHVVRMAGAAYDMSGGAFDELYRTAETVAHIGEVTAALVLMTAKVCKVGDRLALCLTELIALASHDPAGPYGPAYMRARETVNAWVELVGGAK